MSREKAMNKLRKSMYFLGLVQESVAYACSSSIISTERLKTLLDNVFYMTCGYSDYLESLVTFLDSLIEKLQRIRSKICEELEIEKRRIQLERGLPVEEPGKE